MAVFKVVAVMSVFVSFGSGDAWCVLTTEGDSWVALAWSCGELLLESRS
jgi:hypothetical protein